MRKTIDLNRAAASADARTFETAVKASDGLTAGAGSFTTSGQDKNDAPVRSQIAENDFTASGVKPDTAPVSLSAGDFSASGGGKPPASGPSLSAGDFTASGFGKTGN